MSIYQYDVPLILQHYQDRFCQVRRAPWKGDWALQKPVLILTLIDWVEKGKLRMNRVILEDGLFQLFRQNWRLLVDDYPERKVFRPLFHLQSDGFWRLLNRQGNQVDAFVGSKLGLEKSGIYGQLDEPLFRLLQIADFRQILRMVVVGHFFPEKGGEYVQENPHYLFEHLSSLEMAIRQGGTMAKFGKKVIRYEGYLRNMAFRRVILQLYDHRCCVSDLRVFADVPMIEAAHIVPFTSSGNNSPRNGLALCPNLHRAFDWGLISITDDYRVLVRKGLRESEDSLYRLNKIEGRSLSLPQDDRFCPDPHFLGHHRNRFGF